MNFLAVKLLFSQVTMYQDPNKHCTVGLNTLPETDTDTAMVYSPFSVVLVVLLPSLLMVARTRPAASASDLQDALNAVLAEEDDTTVHSQGILI